MRRLFPILLAFTLGMADAVTVEITQAPAPVVMAWAGESATLTVNATGVAPVTYQWHRNGLPIAGATGGSHAIASMSEAAAGLYAVTIADGAGDLKMAFSRVALPGAVLQFSGGQLSQGAAGDPAAIPVVLSNGDPTLAIVGDDGRACRLFRSSDDHCAARPRFARGRHGEPAALPGAPVY